MILVLGNVNKGGIMIERNESILTSIKKLLGIVEDYTQFDADIIMHINSVLSLLKQIGIGPINGFSISDSSEKWSDFIGDNTEHQMVVSYIYLKVRLLFDPPTSSILLQSINDQIKEYEWRLSISNSKRIEDTDE